MTRQIPFKTILAALFEAYPTERGVNFVRKWVKFHRQNKHVWKAFEKRVLQKILGAPEKIVVGAIGVVDELRRDKSIQVSSPEFKVDNRFAPIYARIFLTKYPQYKDFIEVRKTKT